MKYSDNQIALFQQELSLSKRSKEVLKERMIEDDLIKEFELGFCPPSSNFTFDLLNGRIIVPIHDAYGELIAFSGRRVDAYSTDVNSYYKHKMDSFNAIQRFMKWKTSKWVNTSYSKKAHLFNLNRAKRHIYELGYCIVVEGYFDVIALHRMGVYNVVAICSVSMSNQHCDLIGRYCKKIVLMLDGDEAGIDAIKSSIERARSKNLFVNVVKLKDSIDPDQLTQDQLSFICNKTKTNDEELLIKI